MPRDQVYQLRLTKDEKDRLASMATARELSIAGLIRAELQLDVEVRRVTLSVPDEPEHSASEIKRLAMQRYSHLPLAFAERKVREELG